MLNLSMRISVLSLILVSFGCEAAYEEVRITMFDYRFIPDQLHVKIGSPVRVFIRNQGRETHRFKSALLRIPGVTTSSGSPIETWDIQKGIPVTPGKTIQIVFTPPRGQYGFHCPIRGHQGMNGVFIVEEPDIMKPS